jgi:hypothetical protein
MTIRRRSANNRKVLRPRPMTPYRALTLDDSGWDELLDDWMVACPTVELVPPGQPL